MFYKMDNNLKNQIVEQAKMFNLNKVILFGSRAMGTNLERSDIDLAISGLVDQYMFKDALDANVNSLLRFDIVSLDSCSDTLLNEINKYGVVVYEKN